MKICAISDLHGNLIHIQKCDLCLIAGDVVPLNIQKNRVESIVWLFQDFLPWIKELPCEEVYMVAGNHDFICASEYPVMKALEYLSDFKFTYLLNDCATYRAPNGINYKVYGSPQCHVFGNWAFMHSEEFLEGLYNQVPNNIDIWLTHDTPALGDLDLLPPSRWSQEPIHAGGQSLAKAIQRVKPKYVFCGHLHTCKDKYLKLDNTEIYNVSILDNDYHISYEPTYLEIN